MITISRKCYSASDLWCNRPDTVTPNSTSYRTETTTSFTISTPGSHTITFQGLGSASGNNTALIDRVVVALDPGGQVPVVTRNADFGASGDRNKT
jgi:hypothetical protein